MMQSPLCRRSLSLALLCAFLFSSVFAPARALAWGEFTIKDERELGEKFNVLIRSRMPLVQDAEVVDYVNGLVDRLSRNLPPQPFPFKTSVILHNAVNAFATPGGYLFVHTGLILAMDNESEVAGVLAHEMAHVTQRHIARRIESSQLVGMLSLLGALAGAFLGGQGASAAMVGSLAAGQAAMLHYSRNDEREADQVGMNYLTQAGYSVQGMVGAFQILSRKQWLMGSDIPSYLSTHPDLEERVQDMQVRISRLSQGKRGEDSGNAAFLRVQALIRARYGDPEPATQAFAKQLNGPHRCIALMGMGILASRLNRINDANASFDQALACAPHDELIVREAGRHHYTKGDKNKGGALLAQAVSMNRNDTMALFYQARNLGDLGQTGEAIEFARQVLYKVPEDAEVHDLLARLYGARREFFQANLHMAYSGLYENNERRVTQFLDKAKTFAKSPEQKSKVERFEKEYKERKQFWK